MKSSVHLLVSVQQLFAGFLILSAVTFRTYAEQLPAGLVKALKEGNASAVASYLAEQTELTLPDQECTCPRIKAQQVLSSFFETHPPLNYNTIHEGHNEQYQYTIGIYRSTHGKFRLFILLKEVNGQTRIHQIRIDQSDD